MRDFNFFDIEQKNIKTITQTSNYFFKIVVVLFLMLILWVVATIAYGSYIEKQLNELQYKVSGLSTYTLLEVKKEKEYALQNIEKQKNNIENVHEQLQQDMWLTEELLVNILNYVPKDMRFEEVTISDDKQVDIVGYSISQTSIAKLETNLRKTKQFTSLYVQTISESEPEYRFLLTFEVKGESE